MKVNNILMKNNKIKQRDRAAEPAALFLNFVLLFIIKIMLIFRLTSCILASVR